MKIKTLLFLETSLIIKLFRLWWINDLLDFFTASLESTLTKQGKLFPNGLRTEIAALTIDILDHDATIDAY